jgi:two-component system response regulator YesN
LTGEGVINVLSKLLLVDDEKPIREKLKNNIDWKQEGYQIFSAVNGEEALEIIENEDIDILVTDIQMPKLSGINLIEKCRKINSKLKIIVISGYAEFEYAQKSIRFGVNEYLLKPFRSQRLLEVVNKAREDLEMEKNREAKLEELRKEISRYINEKQISDSYNWLIEDTFFESQSMILKKIKLETVLKRGSRDDILEAVNKIISEMSDLSLNKDKLFIILNNIILESFKIMKELDYGAEDLLEVINKEDLEMLNYSNLKEVEVFLKELLLHLHNLICFNPAEKNQQMIQQMKEYIADNYQKGITLSEMARDFNISISYLSSLFHEETGESFSEYLNLLRLNKAKELLKSTDIKIYQIADRLGFNDAYYFSSWFKKQVGASPTTYRDNINLL